MSLMSFIRLMRYSGEGKREKGEWITERRNDRRTEKPKEYPEGISYQ